MKKQSKKIKVTCETNQPCNRIKWGDLHDELTPESRNTKLYKFLNQKMLLKKWIKNYMKTSSIVFEEGLNEHFENEGNKVKSFSNVFIFHDTKEGWAYWNERQQQFAQWCETYKIKLNVVHVDESKTQIELEFNIHDIGDKYRFVLIDLRDAMSLQSLAGIVGDEKLQQILSPLCERMVRDLLLNDERTCDKKSTHEMINELIKKYECFDI